MDECIEKDWITWHAFPFVAQLEIMDEFINSFMPQSQILDFLRNQAFQRFEASI